LIFIGLCNAKLERAITSNSSYTVCCGNWLLIKSVFGWYLVSLWNLW